MILPIYNQNSTRSMMLLLNRKNKKKLKMLPNNDFWWEEEVFNKNHSPPTIDATKIIVDDIKEKTDDALKNIDIQAILDNILKNL